MKIKNRREFIKTAAIAGASGVNEMLGQCRII
jgi:hypothetical protein